MGYNSQRYLSYMYQINYILFREWIFFGINLLYLYIRFWPFYTYKIEIKYNSKQISFFILNSTIKYTLPNYYHQLNIIGFKPILIYYWSDTNIICTFWIFGVHNVPIIRYIYIWIESRVGKCFAEKLWYFNITIYVDLICCGMERNMNCIYIPCSYIQYISVYIYYYYYITMNISYPYINNNIYV